MTAAAAIRDTALRARIVVAVRTGPRAVVDVLRGYPIGPSLAVAIRRALEAEGVDLATIPVPSDEAVARWREVRTPKAASSPRIDRLIESVEAERVKVADLVAAVDITEVERDDARREVERLRLVVADAQREVEALRVEAAALRAGRDVAPTASAPEPAVYGPNSATTELHVRAATPVPSFVRAPNPAPEPRLKLLLVDAQHPDGVPYAAGE